MRAGNFEWLLGAFFFVLYIGSALAGSSEIQSGIFFVVSIVWVCTSSILQEIDRGEDR